MTDRADEIAETYANEGGAVKAVAAAIRAYGDDCHNTALDEAAEAADMVDTVAGEAIRALKEKP